MKLFEQFKLGSNLLQNRFVMSPLTRCRAIGNVPNALMAKYYGQRAAAGLIIAPSAVAAKGQMWTDQQGNQPLPIPQEMTTTEIESNQRKDIYGTDRKLFAVKIAEGVAYSCD